MPHSTFTPDRAHAARVAMLQRLRVANSDTDPSFDRLVRIAAQAARTPIALITLLASDRQWIKAEVGFPRPSTSLSESFCLYALEEPGFLEVGDTSQDARFKDNPLVTGPEHIRFYAGYPIAFHGLVLGAVCVLDTVPRHLREEVRPILSDLSGLVADLLETRCLQLAVSEEQRRAMEEGISRAAAEEANKNKSEFLSRVSHELRTPLNAILGFGQLMLIDQSSPLSEVQSERIKIVHKAGEQLLSLVDDLLEVSRAEQGALSLNMRAVSLRPLIDQAMQLVAPSAMAEKISLHCSVDHQLAVMADERALGQVLLNLLSNAVKYNKPDGLVSVHATTGGQSVVLSVQDSGKGFTPEQLADLFQPFNRLGAEDTQVTGSGLGLVIAKALAIAMGGDLTVDSEVGVGSSIHVRLRHASEPGQVDHPDQGQAAS